VTMREIFCSPMRFFADPPGKPALFLMHGFMSSRNHWRLNEPALRSRYRLVIAELPGHGNTPPCSDPAQISPDVLSECIEEARRALNISRWHVCGQSFGAGLVLRYALNHPEGVAALAWTNANRVLMGPLRPEEISQLHRRGDRVEQGGLDALRQERVYPGTARYFPPEMRELLGREADNCDPATIAAIIRHALSYVTVRDRFAQLAMPVLLINGLRERSFQTLRDQAAALLPSMEIVDLDGGHSINIEQPAAFDSALLDFLARHDKLLAPQSGVLA